jgi:hypothetical protein
MCQSLEAINEMRGTLEAKGAECLLLSEAFVARLSKQTDEGRA